MTARELYEKARSDYFRSAPFGRIEDFHARLREWRDKALAVAAIADAEEAEWAEKARAAAEEAERRAVRNREEEAARKLAAEMAPILEWERVEKINAELLAAQAAKGKDDSDWRSRVFGPAPAERIDLDSIPPDWELAKLPSRVAREVRRAVLELQRKWQAWERAKSLDRTHGGEGRYEFETLGPGYVHKSATLEEFFALAPSNGVDADKVVSELGGIPEIVPTKDYREWEAELS